MPGFDAHLRRLASTNGHAKALPVGAPGTGAYLGDWWRYGLRATWPGAAQYDYGRHDLSANSVVSLALGFIRKNVDTGRIVTGIEQDDGTYKEVPRHPLTKVLRRPNNLHSWSDTLGATAYCIARWGYSYWIKSRLKLSGEVVEVQWVPNHSIEVVPETNLGVQADDGPIRAYRYTAGKFVRDYPPEDVVHFKDGIDMACPWQGTNELQHQAKNAAAVDFGEGLTVASLRNGNAGKLVSPKEVVGQVYPGGFEENEMRATARRIEAGVSGENFGRFTNTSLPVDVHDIGLGPEEMALLNILDRPTSFLLAVCGLNGIALGVPSQDQSTYENKLAAFRDALRFGILPIHKIVANTVEFRLLRDFDGGEQRRVWWDYRNVELEDPTEKVNRAATAFAAKVAKRNEVRDWLDLPPDEERGDLYDGETPGGEEPPPDDPEADADPTPREDPAGADPEAEAAEAKALDWLGGDESGAAETATWLDEAIKAAAKPAGKAGKAGKAGGKAHWITVWSRRANRFVHVRIEGAATTRGKRRVTKVVKGSPQQLEQSVRRSLHDENAVHLDVKVEHGPPRNAAEKRFAEKAHAQGKVAVVIERVPRVREDSSGDRTKFFVGGRPASEVRPVEARDRERVHSEYADVRAKHPEGFEPNVTDPGHAWVRESIAARLDGDNPRASSWVETRRDFEGSYRNRESAEKAARSAADYAVKDEAKQNTDRIVVGNVEKHLWADDAMNDPEWTTTFRLIAGGKGE